MRYYSNQPLDEFDIREMLNNERGEDAYYLSSEETIDASIKMVDGVPTPEEGGHANDIPKE